MADDEELPEGLLGEPVRLRPMNSAQRPRSPGSPALSGRSSSVTQTRATHVKAVRQAREGGSLPGRRCSPGGGARKKTSGSPGSSESSRRVHRPPPIIVSTEADLSGSDRSSTGDTQRSSLGGPVSLERTGLLRKEFESITEATGRATVTKGELWKVFQAAGVEELQEADLAHAVNILGLGDSIDFNSLLRVYTTGIGQALFRAAQMRGSVGGSVCDIWDIHTRHDGKSSITESVRSADTCARSADTRTRTLPQEKPDDAYITDTRRQGRQRINDILYDMPAFAPDYVYRRAWDVVVLAAIMYCVLVPSTDIVLEVGRASEYEVAGDTLLTVVLVLDILATMNTAVQPQRRSIEVIADRSQIFRLYLRTYFVPDLLSALPCDVLAWWLGYDGRVWRYCRALRLLKLLKYPALFTMTDRGAMDAGYVRFYFVVKPVIHTFFVIVVAAHALTLGRAWISPSAKSCEGIVYGLDACTKGVAARYLYAAWWNWALVTSQGSAAIENGKVYVYASFVFICGLVLQGHVVAKLSALYLDSNIEERNKESMRETYRVMKEYGIPSSLQTEVLSYQYHTVQRSVATNFAHILNKLPPTMQLEVGLYVKVDLVSQVPMFRQLSTRCKLELAACLEATFCEPDQTIVKFGEQGTAMYFMMHGFADVLVPFQSDAGLGFHTVATIKRGDFFGEVVLLKPQMCRTATVQALTYCDLFKLSLANFQELMTQFSELRGRMSAEAETRGLIEAAEPRMGARRARGTPPAADAPAQGVTVLGLRENPLGSLHRQRSSGVASRTAVMPFASDEVSESSDQDATGPTIASLMRPAEKQRPVPEIQLRAAPPEGRKSRRRTNSTHASTCSSRGSHSGRDTFQPLAWEADLDRILHAGVREGAQNLVAGREGVLGRRRNKKAALPDLQIDVDGRAPSMRRTSSAPDLLRPRHESPSKASTVVSPHMKKELALDERLALAEARTLSRLHLAEERMAKQVWQNAQRVASLHMHAGSVQAAIDLLQLPQSNFHSPQQDMLSVLDMTVRGRGGGSGTFGHNRLP
eukprot:TRINITY_DN17413_c0_g2_i1.p1 TRINITY_DN17413_c0_g2~~TRINITY_DN17413_c0_g2_i1.p1  ORF type:complete len:1055 (+),score=268.63 TRINITY_DN17413_c0_g2_i1:47-3166(+)